MARGVNYDDFIVDAIRDPDEAAAYLEAVIELNDAPALLVALRDVARAHGIAEIARRANLGEKTLFRSLSSKGNPTFSTICSVLKAMGLRLSIAPAHG